MIMENKNITILNNNNRTKSVTVVKNSLKFLSWNIQAPSTAEGDKFQIKEFKDVLQTNDIICLQETRRDVHLSGYRAECNTRKDNKYGGVAILVKNEFSEGIDFIKDVNFSDYLVCRLKKNFFQQDEDIFVVNVYARPHNSSESNETDKGREVLSKIEDTINDLKEKGEVVLCGDFNARIAHQTGMIRNDISNFLPMPEDYEPDNYKDRNSQDGTTNSHCKQFISLVSNNQLTILNGRTLGDLQGQFTSIQLKGCSVIDYFAVSSRLHRKVNFLKIQNLTMYSDHRPLVMELRCPPIAVDPPKKLNEDYQKAPPRFIFDDSNKDNFIEAQNSEASKITLHSLNTSLGTLPKSNPSDNIKTVRDINDKFTEHIRNLATFSFKQTKVGKKKTHDKNNPWFGWQARLAKCEFRKSTKIISEFPTCDVIRENFYRVKGNYRRLLKKCETTYFENLNREIEEGKVLNWQSFKKLKQHKNKKLDYDSTDMKNFENFFRDLYTDNHNTINSEQKSELMKSADKINNTAIYHDSLNKAFTLQEVILTLKSLKSGKASSTDMVSNEILKCLDTKHVEFLTNLFNSCLDHGIYPWNESIISPLHKKGNVSNPDNYRAIAVSSVIGKVFSTILLERLKLFKKENCPDPPNQLGFTKGAQTYDHILTMQTIASKYKKMHKPVYAVFVDFKKAFDSVCRQALFYKLAKLGVTGKFYSVLKTMYANSFAYVKLSGHLSRRISIQKGTEQGHPLSPDLFKIFVSDLSPLLESNCSPELSNTLISHLLWADDLIMLSLNPKACQQHLNILGKYCNDWGLEVNELKTQIVIFGKLDINSRNVEFNLLGKAIKVVEDYCYLGIVLHNSGELRTAQQTLKTKAIRAFFGLKRTIIRSKVSFKALTTLFDSLIKPVVLYGAPIWTPTSAINKSIIKCCNTPLTNVENFVSKINRTVSEKVHLSFLKWALGVHRKASNVGVWGESGRYPLIYQSIRLTLNYYKRLSHMPDNTFVKAALHEQKLLNLPWFKNIEPLLKLDEVFHQDHVTAFRTINNIKSARSNKMSDSNSVKPLPSRKFRVKNIMNTLTDHFEDCWKHEKSKSAKLSFYNTCKSKFAREPYLDVTKGFSRRYNTTKFRISSHDLEIECGRYNNIPRESRICTWCQLSMGAQVIEDENHVLHTCDLYAGLRAKLITRLNNAPMAHHESLPELTINRESLKEHFTTLISPHLNISNENTNTYNMHHNMTTDDNEDSQHRRSYIINCLCTFLCQSLEKRHKYVKDMRDNQAKLNTLVINFNENK